MTEDTALAIEADPRFRELVRRRGWITAALSAIILAAYLGFLLLVAFAKPLLARPVGGGVTSLGIMLGCGIILLTIALTGFYVRYAAARFDPLVDALRREYGR